MTKETYFYPDKGFSIEIDLSRDTFLSEAGKAILKDRYLLKAYNQEKQKWVLLEISPQECFARVSCEYATNKEQAQRLYNYMSKFWFMPATPILTNAGTKRGLPISCFVNYVEDSVKGISEHLYENFFLSSYGGGIGGDWSSLRADSTRTSRGNISTGVIPFVKVMDSSMLAFQQGSTRRGSYAANLDISHPEIEEFIDIRRPTSTDLNRRCLGEGFHHCVNICNSFMEKLKNNEQWDLVDPHTKEIKKTVSARDLWLKILEARIETGEPYLHFKDTSNKYLPSKLKEKGLKIQGTNLCSEIFLPTNKDRTAVCCLSSVNLEYYDDWSEIQEEFLSDITEFLDNVLLDFISKAPDEMHRAKLSAYRERSIGIGTMGFYIYLQKRGVSFESPVALGINRSLYKNIKEDLIKASKRLASERGEAPDMEGSGLRFAHLMAIAPNANISFICGNTSPSVEPFNANIFVSKTLSGSFVLKNKQLDKVLKEKYHLTGEKLEDVWSKINSNNGSVQQLEFMEDIDKEIFKTAFELDQMWIIEHAAIRQEFICQGQSINLFLPPDVHISDLHKIHYSAWQKGLKSLYYLRSKPIKKVENVSDSGVLSFEDTCVACT